MEFRRRRALPLRDSDDRGWPPIDLAAGAVFQAARDGQQCALARAAGAHDGHQRPGVDREIDALEGVHIWGAFAVDLGDVA
jgi:hypothetical protein